MDHYADDQTCEKEAEKDNYRGDARHLFDAVVDLLVFAAGIVWFLLVVNFTTTYSPFLRSLRR